MTSLIIKTITILSLLALASSQNDVNKKAGEKLTHLHFYFHDVVSGPNATVVHVAGPPMSIKDPKVGFGATFIFDDPLTLGPEPTSKRIGSAQGSYAFASQTDFVLLESITYVFTDGEFKGSGFSVLGRNAILTKVRELPVVGGTGVFRFARGFAQLKTFLFNTTSLDAIVEYDVYLRH